MQLFLGERLASDLGRVADRFRASPGNVVPDAQPETACTAAPSRLPGRPPLGLLEEQAPLAQPPPAACHHPLGLPEDRASAATHVSLAHVRPVTPLAPSSLPSGAAATTAPLAEQAPAPNHSSRRSPPCQRPSTRGRGARRSRTVSRSRSQDCRHSSSHSRARPAAPLPRRPGPLAHLLKSIPFQLVAHLPKSIPLSIGCSTTEPEAS